MSDDEVILPMPPDRQDINDLYSQPILIKAHRLVDKVQPVEAHVFEVPGSGGRLYRLQVSAPAEAGELAFVTCTCPNGVARGGRPSCYHSAAVLLYLEKIAANFETPSFSELLDEVRKRLD